jgi:hypothetical protein
LAKEPWTAWRFVMATSPGAQTIGTASGSRSEPAAATIPRMSARRTACDPGTTQTPLAGVQP